MRTNWGRVRRTPDSITILGCDVNINSICKKEFCNKCEGSFFNYNVIEIGKLYFQ